MADNAQTQEMFVVAFQGTDKAGQVQKTLQQLDNQKVIELKNVAIVVRDRGGTIEIRETRDFTTGKSTLGGALAGGLMGVITGQGLLKGAAMGAAGGLFTGKVTDLGFQDDFLKQVAQLLPPDSSAVVAVVRFDQVDQAMQVLDQFSGGSIMRQTLSPDVAQKLSAALED
jgi:uncharacterized membrane protein